MLKLKFKRWTKRESMPQTPKPALAVVHEDLCYTNLLNDPEGPIWTRGNLKAVPWSRVLELPALDSVRQTADYIYDIMARAGGICPKITRERGDLRLEYECDGRIAVFHLDPQELTLEVNGEPLSIYRINNVVRWVAEGGTL